MNQCQVVDKVYADDDFIIREKAIDKIRSHKQLHNQDKILLRVTG
jgi:hypothetical protein